MRKQVPQQEQRQQSGVSYRAATKVAAKKAPWVNLLFFFCTLATTTKVGTNARLFAMLRGLFWETDVWVVFADLPCRHGPSPSALVAFLIIFNCFVASYSHQRT